MGGIRTSRRAHEASHTSCAGRGHGTSRAVAHQIRLPTWGTGPAPAHPEPETPARRLQLGEQHGRRCGPMGWRARRMPRGTVVHYGPRTSGPGYQLGRAEDVVRQYGLWPPGLACRLGGRVRLRRSPSPRRQLEKLQLGELQDLAASPRGVSHVVCRARSRYTTGLGPSGSAADLGDRASSSASGARDASEETPAWRATWTLLRAHGVARIGSSQSEREFRNSAALQFPENRGATIIIEF